MDKDIYVKDIAKESLEVFSVITDKASKQLSERSNTKVGAESMVHMNTLTGGEKSVSNLISISESNQKDLLELLVRPAFARIVVRDEDEQEETFYVTRRTSIAIDHDANLVSYLNPIGRLASIPVGDEEEIEFKGRKQYYEVLENTAYRPVHKDALWDSEPTVFRSDSGVFTVESLRALLEGKSQEDGDAILAAIMDGQPEEAKILEGLRSEVRTSMVLRDQPILDQFQDTIFRLPINTQLLIIGPPGTGKTTTLIRRLAQKLTPEALGSGERALVIPNERDIEEHQNSWLMFTPTDLLKHFVKEAFNREQVPVSATDEKIKTWESYRGDLARRVLGILKTANSGGKFIFKSKDSYVNEEIRLNPVYWFEAIKSFHSQRIINQLNNGIDLLGKLVNDENQALYDRLKGITDGASSKPAISLLTELYNLEGEVSDYVTKLKEISDEEIRKSLALLLNSEKLSIDDFVIFLNSQKKSDTAEEDDDNEFDDDVEEQQEESRGAITKRKAVTAYGRTIRSLAKSKYLKRSLAINSSTKKIRDWLGSRVPDDEKLLEIGQNIATQSGLRRFTKVHSRYVQDVPSSYREFRKLALKNKDSQYSASVKSNQHIDSTELDAITLLMLRNARELLSQRFVSNNMEQPAFAGLSIIAEQFKNQILVDEATDFSPLQLASMEALTALKTRSFFACGDFNQRITRWGIRSQEQMEWVSSQIKTQAINIIYRQSQKLNEFAGELLKQFDGDLGSRGALPTEMQNVGVAPVLLEGANEVDDIAIWLVERLQEVERIAGIGKLPTVAVLVNSREEVDPMTDALNEVAEEISLRAVACSDQSLGEETDIRVFDVQHIKGLEFEAVFFVGVDKLSLKEPELFGKYLYVGATRAATHFGITCDQKLPQTLEVLRDQFTENWESVA